MVRTKAAVKIEGLTVRFGSYTALSRVDLEVAEGEFLAVVGPTGCGKSTLLNVVSGLLTPSEGRVYAFGEEVRGPNPKVGYLFQQDAILPWKTALDNVALPLVFKGVPLRRAREEARLRLEKVGLKAFAHRFPHQLSGGQRKRVGLAQVLITNPKLLLMDEPFSALDIQTRQRMENELLRLWQAEDGEGQKTVLFITHDLEEAIALADRVVVFSAGPGSRPIGEFPIPLPRPRDVAEIRLTEGFLRIHREIWGLLRKEVEKAYEG